MKRVSNLFSASKETIIGRAAADQREEVEEEWDRLEKASLKVYTIVVGPTVPFLCKHHYIVEVPGMSGLLCTCPV